MTNNDSTLVFSTSSNGAVVDNFSPVEDKRTMNMMEAAQVAFDAAMSEPHCFVCGRHTDHWGEHDDLVEQGKARYEQDGSVYPVSWGWDA